MTFHMGRIQIRPGLINNSLWGSVASSLRLNLTASCCFPGSTEVYGFTTETLFFFGEHFVTGYMGRSPHRAWYGVGGVGGWGAQVQTDRPRPEENTVSPAETLSGFFSDLWTPTVKATASLLQRLTVTTKTVDL